MYKTGQVTVWAQRKSLTVLSECDVRSERECWIFSFRKFEKKKLSDAALKYLGRELRSWACEKLLYTALCCLSVCDNNSGDVTKVISVLSFAHIYCTRQEDTKASRGTRTNLPIYTH